MDSNEYEYKLRDQFAMAALPVIMEDLGDNITHSSSISRRAYMIADAMMEKRKKQ